MLVSRQTILDAGIDEALLGLPGILRSLLLLLLHGLDVDGDHCCRGVVLAVGETTIRFLVLLRARERKGRDILVAMSYLEEWQCSQIVR